MTSLILYSLFHFVGYRNHRLQSSVVWLH